MFANADITTQPVFYLFIALSILLSLGFTWGRRRNARILHGAMNALMEVLRARDQQFTNIGGQTGYHANIIPGAAKYIRRVDVTLTLLPRQSWLYLPMSYLIRKFDRLYLIFVPNKKGRSMLKEGHLIEQGFEKFRGSQIQNAETLSRDEIEWGTMRFNLYFQDEDTKNALLDLKHRIGETPGNFRHAALVPQQDQAFLFQIPRPETVAPITAAFRDWLDDFVDRQLEHKAAHRSQ